MIIRSKIPKLVCWLLGVALTAGNTFGQPGNRSNMPDPTSWPGDDNRPPPARDRFVCFPPTAPAFGAPIANGQSRLTVNGVRIVTPDLLADFANENFYPALSIRLLDGSLSKKLIARLETYQTTRTNLINELKAQLQLTEASDPATREQALRAFAVSQTPRIVALEREAEQFRGDLVSGSLLQSAADWNEIRDWRLGALPASSPALAANAEFQVIRAAAYFQKGFSIEQRGLLREIAMTEWDKLRPSPRVIRPASTGANDPRTIFFSPETARLGIPPQLPADLSDKIGVYYHDKIELSDELRSAVVAQDQNTAATRTRNFEALANRQSPRLAALADLAEEIRRGLASLPKPPPPAAPPDLPPELVARINALRHDMRALADERIASIRQAAGTPIKPDPNQPIIERIRQSSNLQAAAIKRAEDEFQQENAGRYAELNQRRAALRESLAAEAKGRTDPSTGKPMEAATLLRIFNLAEQQFDKLGREEVIYKDYNIAMLQPGLSPGQRRLLFGAALVALAQPLPAPQRMSSQLTSSF